MLSHLSGFPEQCFFVSLVGQMGRAPERIGFGWELQSYDHQYLRNQIVHLLCEEAETIEPMLHEELAMQYLNDPGITYAGWVGT